MFCSDEFTLFFIQVQSTLEMNVDHQKCNIAISRTATTSGGSRYGSRDRKGVRDKSPPLHTPNPTLMPSATCYNRTCSQCLPTIKSEKRSAAFVSHKLLQHVSSASSKLLSYQRAAAEPVLLKTGVHCARIAAAAACLVERDT